MTGFALSLIDAGGRAVPVWDMGSAFVDQPPPDPMLVRDFSACCSERALVHLLRGRPAPESAQRLPSGRSLYFGIKIRQAGFQET